MSDDDNETEGKLHDNAVYHLRTPPQLRRLLSKIRIPLQPENYILLVFECMRIVNDYAGHSPPFLKLELAVSLLNEIQALDQFDQHFSKCVADMQNLIDSGQLDQLKASRVIGCPCNFC